MFEVICPQCRETVSGHDENSTMREYSFHWLQWHDEEPAIEPPERQQ